MVKDLNNFGAARMNHSTTNCKLSTIEGIKYLIGSGFYDTPEEKVQRVKNFLNTGRTVVSLNTNDPDIKNFFEKNFNVFSSIEVPVGYNNGYQYHLILNNNKGYWRTPAKKPIPKLDADMSNLEEVLTKILKSKRRKTDIVKDVMENLK